MEDYATCSQMVRRKGNCMILWQTWTSWTRPFKSLFGTRNNGLTISHQYHTGPSVKEKARIDRRVVYKLKIETKEVVVLYNKFYLPSGSVFYVKEPSQAFFDKACELVKNKSISCRYWLEDKIDWAKEGF